jgi:uncharacterized protein YkwD
MAQNAAPGFKGDISTIESEVLVALSAARMSPSDYAKTLRRYRGFFHANVVTMPGATTDFETEEGVVPVDEAIAFLTQQPPLVALEKGTTLVDAARDHVREQGSTGRTGHYSADGSGPAERNVRHGGGKQIAEVIAYGATDAIDVIRQLIVDDGVRDRGHRVLIYADHLRYAGVACGPHPEFGTMCVIDMSDTPDGKAGSGGQRPKVQVAARDGTKPSGQ